MADRVNGVIELPAEQREELARKGVELIEAKSEKAEMDAGYLCSCYENGTGVEKNHDTAYQWFLTSIEHESPERQKVDIERWHATRRLPEPTE